MAHWQAVVSAAAADAAAARADAAALRQELADLKAVVTALNPVSGPAEPGSDPPRLLELTADLKRYKDRFAEHEAKAANAAKRSEVDARTFREGIRRLTAEVEPLSTAAVRLHVNALGHSTGTL